MKSLAGNVCRIRLAGISDAVIPFGHTSEGMDLIEFPTEAGKTYVISGIPAHQKKPVPGGLMADMDLTLRWDFDGPVAVWRAADSSPAYEPVAADVTGGSFRASDFDFSRYETVTDKVTRADAEDATADGAVVTLNHSTAMDRQRHRYLVEQLNAVCGEEDHAEIEHQLERMLPEA